MEGVRRVLQRPAELVRSGDVKRVRFGGEIAVFTDNQIGGPRQIRCQTRGQALRHGGKQLVNLPVRSRKPGGPSGDFPLALGRIDDGFADVGAVHDSGQRVVIGRGNGVELVIVATGAGDGEPQECLADDVDLVVNLVGAGLDRVGGAVEDFSKPVNTGADRGSE